MPLFMPLRYVETLCHFVSPLRDDTTLCDYVMRLLYDTRYAITLCQCVISLRYVTTLCDKFYNKYATSYAQNYATKYSTKKYHYHMPLRYATTLCNYVMPQGMPQVRPQVIPKVMQPVMQLHNATTSCHHIMPLPYAINYSLPNLSKINTSSKALDIRRKTEDSSLLVCTAQRCFITLYGVVIIIAILFRISVVIWVL